MLDRPVRPLEDRFAAAAAGGGLRRDRPDGVAWSRSSGAAPSAPSAPRRPRPCGRGWSAPASRWPASAAGSPSSCPSTRTAGCTGCGSRRAAAAWTPPPLRQDPPVRRARRHRGRRAAPGRRDRQPAAWPGPRPGVVLLSGGGQFDRDATSGANKPLKDLAWGLAGRAWPSCASTRSPTPTRT